jgi:hypothetical protein
MVEPRPASNWVHISSQNRWHGVIFKGDPHCRIVPQCQASDNRSAYNSQWSVQSHGTLICQKLKTSERTRAMRVWFPAAGLVNRIEAAGWIFVEAPEAFAAVRVVTGGTTWEPETRLVKGDWLRCADEWTPVILEVACKSDYTDAAAFRKAVAALPVKFERGVLTYRGLSGEAFRFNTSQKELPQINSVPVDFAPSKVFDSPFVQSVWNSGVVTIQKDGRTHRLDFNRP